MWPELFSFRYGQIDGYTNINVAFFNETFIDVRVDILQTLMKPTWGIELTRWRPGQNPTIFFNTTVLLCDMDRLSRRNLFLKAFYESAKGMTNFTLRCPLASGRYFIRISMNGVKRIFPGRLLYQENTFLTIFHRLYEQIPKENYTLFAHALVNCGIKRFC